MKERQSGMKVYFITLIQQLYFKTRRINVIIDFHFMDKTTRKKKKNFNNSENETQRVELNQKRELQKCNETITPLAFIETTSNVTLRVIEAYVENYKCS